MTDELVGTKKKIAKLLEKHGVFDIEDEVLALTVSSGGRVCSKCGGKKLVYGEPENYKTIKFCPTCNGTGRTKVVKKTLGEIIKEHQDGR